ncbi:ABC transporter substrate-binding protein [Gracilibacillus alcaliphilus]|uniref:ABC transporter substrate-binding protein n=1 Tax=Gracilibacillus alcaliphilus TaxID=1401441 RepID=UPI00195EBEDE|nr:sugar ABC transporter substrate-binding protein [Gracilibacillus alcaliphilus]MBM7676817.1 multiple sugar transport system substrate-binding protein [Gracilibacillus alcaliphilus]
MKEITLWGALVLSLVLLMVGCSNDTGSEGDSGEGDKVELRMSIVAGTDEMPGWQGIVDAFNESQTDIEVKLERLPGSWDEYNQKMTAQIASGDPPDIGRIGVAYMPMYSSKGQLEDLSPFIESLNKDDYYDSIFTEYTDGNIYGAPIGVYTMAMYYNKNLFDEAGIEYPPADWEEAWTWDQYKEAAEKITKGSGANKQYGAYVGFNPERSIQYLWSNNGGLINEEMTEPIVNTEESKEALTFLQSLIQSGISPTPAETETMPVDQLFKTGRLGMIAEGQWMMPSFAEIDSFEWGVAPIPRSSKGEAVTPNFIDKYVIYKGSDHVEEAWEAIEFFMSEEAENILVDHGLGGIPTLKSVAEERENDMFNPLNSEEKAVWFQSVDYSREVPFTNNWQELMNESMKKFDLVGLDELEADKAADELAPILEGLLEEANQ